MPRMTSCFPSADPAICRRCAGCGGVLRVTPQDEILCPRCGRVRAWTVNVNDLAGKLADLRLVSSGPPVGGAYGECVMVFKVNFEGESISCSSPRCIQRLLSQGWRLADPSQTEDLLQALEAEELAETAEVPHPRNEI